MAAPDITLYGPYLLIIPTTGGLNLVLDSNTALGLIDKVYNGSVYPVNIAVVYDTRKAIPVANPGNEPNYYVIPESAIYFKENPAP